MTSILDKLLLSIFLAHGLSGVGAADPIYGYEDPELNLLNNWDFEDDLSKNDWTLPGTTATRVEGGQTGSYALSVTERSSKQFGPSQKVEGLKPGTVYYVSSFIKLITTGSSKPYTTCTSYVYVFDGSKLIRTIRAGMLKYETVTGRFVQLGGDFKTPSHHFTSVRFVTSVDPETAQYHLDTYSLIEVPEILDWEAEADERIEKIRKNYVNLRVKIPKELDLDKTKVKVELVRHEFGFGSAIKANNFLKASNDAYQNFILDNFNWVVFENAMKWGQMEKTRGEVNYQHILNVMDILQDRNISVRGHALLWAVQATNPAWVQGLSGQDMMETVDRRIRYFLDYFGGQLCEIDVCNEYLQKHFFEDATGKLDMLEHEFFLAHEQDPSARLCLNDYLILRGHGVLASNQANLAMRLLSDDVPVHCIGIQAHLRNTPLEPSRFLKRLEIVSQAGLPISITELSLHNDSVSERAKAVHMAYKLLFSHPGVSSITAWGFSDQFKPFSHNYCWTEGPDQTPNDAGEAFLDLMAQWKTVEEFVPTSYTLREKFSAFRGNYKLTIEEDGMVKKEGFFYVGTGKNKIFLRGKHLSL